ncbi:MAG: hypothetical protein HZC41_17480 [Chloroflexi bacterium]|nr:hypothetical protein [Chloroflexota bacterium]
MNKGAPLIGEPVRVTLTIDAPADAVVMLPDFPLEWPPFMVTGVSPAVVTEAGGRKTLHQEITAILWQIGDFETPETWIEYALSGSPESFRIAVEPAFFTVPSVLNPNDLTLRPLKPPLALPYVSPWLLLGSTLILVGAAFGAGRWLRRRRTVHTVQMPEDVVSRTLRELQGISTLPASRAYPLVGDALRKYVEEQAGVPAEEMTTEELLAALQAQPRFGEPHRHELRRILERVDLVKFAQYQPEADSTRKLVQAAARWIETTAARDDKAA